MTKVRALVVATLASAAMLTVSPAPANASGWCNGYVDYDCYMYPSGWYCTAYTPFIAGGCVVGD